VLSSKRAESLLQIDQRFKEEAASARIGDVLQQQSALVTRPAHKSFTANEIPGISSTLVMREFAERHQRERCSSATYLGATTNLDPMAKAAHTHTQVHHVPLLPLCKWVLDTPCSLMTSKA